MTNVFRRCTLPWDNWNWGLDLKHSDTDVLPECTIEFGGLGVAPSSGELEEIWIRVAFEEAGYASAKPHRDDEDLFAVTGYELSRQDEWAGSEDLGVIDRLERKNDEWRRTGICPFTEFYFSKDSRWLNAERDSWAWRQRGGGRPEDAVHFLLDGRDGYVEILAAGLRWSSWHPGSPLMSNVAGDPIATGRWSD